MYIHLNLAQVGTLVQFEGTQIGSVKIETMKFRISIPVGPCNEKLMGSSLFGICAVFGEYFIVHKYRDFLDGNYYSKDISATNIWRTPHRRNMKSQVGVSV